MNHTVKIALGILFVVLIVIIFLSYKKNHIGNDYDFEIYFFNAGKADAILISKNGHYMMVDTGENSLSDDILSYFETNNITKLDYLVLTHFDKDHVGSAASIINKIEIGEVFQSNVEKESDSYTAYIEALKEKKITPTTVTGDKNITLDDVEITINGPTMIYDKNESNNSSLIISLTNKKNKFLLMGDAENQRIKEFNSINQEEYDFIKVPYHGNELKQLDNLLKNRKIEYAVITSSNTELESDETIATLKEFNIKTYLTRNGVVRVFSNGEEIIIKQ